MSGLKWYRISEKDKGPMMLARSEPVRLVVAGKKICLGSSGGKFYAVSDRCPHQGGSLSDGYIEEGCIVCPLHHYRFSLATGRHISENSEGGLETYTVEERNDGLYIGIKTGWMDFA